ncbi:aminoglycoside adenylyltransferase domain-containing protein [Lentilactobacillus hilgardii]|uniref:aminoglycoside adenylyltransferase domain-containing protein n=1 Tax=Lentilactobacillus hilgardii TaxID=1588 RepID=UPI003FA53941
MSDTQRCLQRLKYNYQKILGDNLVGIYLHGSYVMGGYNENVSDLDYLVIVKTPLSFLIKRQLMAITIEKLWPLAPAKGLEFHVLLLPNVKHFRQPMPFDFHFSKMHFQHYQKDPTDYIKSMKGTDPDLAAHITIINHFGRVLVGRPVYQIFDKVPQKIYWQSIIFDIENAKTTIISQPVYVILNLCRALAYKKDRLITSKLSGGQWGLKHLDSQSGSLIQQALTEYTRHRLKSTFSASTDELNIFATKMITKLDL